MSQQLNLRLSKRDSDRLAAHAFLRRIPPTTLAREIVVEFLDSKADTPGVARALSALAEGDAATRSRS